MPLIERYILKRTTRIFLITLGALVATLWVTQLLRELDVVTAKGQAIWVFLLMTVLALPALIQVVAPVALLVAIILTLNSLTSDNELPVISGAGAAPKAVNRPILLVGAIVMLGVAFSHHVVAPGSLAALRGIVTRVRADVIATLVKDGGFRSVDDGLTMHIRQKAPDGSFRGIFVNDERNGDESLQYSAAQGMVLERDGGSFLVLQDGDLVRDDRRKDETNVVGFETYALDLSQIGAPNASALFKAKERSTFYLMEPEPGDPFTRDYPQRVVAELHDRASAPLYALAFAFIALAFLARPRTSRQDRGFAIAATVLLCLALRAAGFAAVAIARGSSAAIPVLYLIPLCGIAFGLYATMQHVRVPTPLMVARAWDRFAWLPQLARRVSARTRLAGSRQP